MVAFQLRYMVCNFFLSRSYSFTRNVVPKGCVSYTSVLSGWKQVALNWVKHHCNLEVLISTNKAASSNSTLIEMSPVSELSLHCFFRQGASFLVFSSISVWVSATYTVLQGVTERWI